MIDITLTQRQVTSYSPTTKTSTIIETDLWTGRGRDLGESFLTFTNNQQHSYQTASQLKQLCLELSQDLNSENPFNKEQIKKFSKVVHNIGDDGDYIIEINY